MTVKGDRTLQEIMDSATKAARQVRRERPGFLESWLIYRRECRCSRGKHVPVDAPWKHTRTITIYDIDGDFRNDLPIGKKYEYQTVCKYCSAPMLRTVGNNY